MQAKQRGRGKVLLATDRVIDEGSLACAARIAHALDSHLDFWMIVETVDEMRSVVPQLEMGVARLKEIAPEVQAEVKKGLAAEIMGGVRPSQYDLVILSFRGRRGLKKVFPRAEVLSILHRAKVNFLVLWGRGRELRKFLFCTGGSTYAQQAVEFGGRIAANIGAEATLLYVAETGPRHPMEGEERGAEPEYTGVKQAFNRALETLSKLGVETKPKVRFGKVADQILAEATSGGYDLIVLGSHGMSGIRSFILGSVSEEVVKRARIPIMVVRARARRGWSRFLRRGG